MFTHGPYATLRAQARCRGVVLALPAGKLARGAWGWAAAPEVDCELFARIADLLSRVTRRSNSLWSNACGRLLASQWWVFFSCELFGSFSRLRCTDSDAHNEFYGGQREIVVRRIAASMIFSHRY